ncbi:hypothetical protein [Streptomyces sp. enrichment culture]|uniref:hypothetical protein n=1 Tax=Streptomyces sp. enrichment culture TaxID=1795815 RepID=UPI003F546186
MRRPAAAFAPEGLVADVGREIGGRGAIRRWAADGVVGGIPTVLEQTPRPGGTTRSPSAPAARPRRSPSAPAAPATASAPATTATSPTD